MTAHPSTAMTRECIRILEGAGYTVVPPGPPHDQHYAIFLDDTWYSEHSIQCRMAGEIPTCRFHFAVADLADRMQGQGRFRVIETEGNFHLERADA